MCMGVTDNTVREKLHTVHVILGITRQTQTEKHQRTLAEGSRHIILHML